jgi:hypothetical protein
VLLLRGALVRNMLAPLLVACQPNLAPNLQDRSLMVGAGVLLLVLLLVLRLEVLRMGRANLASMFHFTHPILRSTIPSSLNPNTHTRITINTTYPIMTSINHCTCHMYADSRHREAWVLLVVLRALVAEVVIKHHRLMHLRRWSVGRHCVDWDGMTPRHVLHNLSWIEHLHTWNGHNTLAPLRVTYSPTPRRRPQRWAAATGTELSRIELRPTRRALHLAREGYGLTWQLQMQARALMVRCLLQQQ